MSLADSSFQKNDIVNIIKKVENLKRLYYSPNTYKICSLEPSDINNIFFGKKLFSAIFNWTFKFCYCLEGELS